jgi:hypothetical protein
MPEYLAVKNWSKYQHYSDRNPPWIKLHKTVLRDYDFMSLSVAQRYHLIACWILAADMDGLLPCSEQHLNRLCKGHRMNLEELIKKGFLIKINAESMEAASKSLALCRELSREKDRDREEKIKIAPPSAGAENPKPEKPKKEKAPPDPRTLEFITWFAEEFKRAGKGEYHPNFPVEGKMVKELLHLGLEELQFRARYFLGQEKSWDFWIEKWGYTIPCFNKIINKLAVDPHQRQLFERSQSNG